MYASVRFVRLSPCLTHQFSSCNFNEFNNLCNTSWPSLRITKPTRQIDGLCFAQHQANYMYSTESSPMFSDEIQYNSFIMSAKTVEEQLTLFESIKSSVSLVNRITVLFNIAKIIQRDKQQQQALEQEREKVEQNQSSVYMELLESISRDTSKCEPRNLANVLWALGKIKEIDHQLVQICEKEILSRGIKAFSPVDISQIVNGCCSLNLTSTEIFPKIQEAILDVQVKMCNFENRDLAAILIYFSKTSNGSIELFDAFLEEILSRDFSMIDSCHLAAFVWSFARKERTADTLFHRVEEVILRRGTSDLKNVEFIQILWAFRSMQKGGEQFFSLMDSELAQRGLKSFANYELLEIMWSFGKINVKGQIFDLAKKEVSSRGVHKFMIHELVLMLYSFVSDLGHDVKLVSEIERELCSRDAKQFCNHHLCQAAWALGQARRWESKLFDAIETEVLQRGVQELTMKNKCMLLRGFLEAKRGSREFFDLLVSSFSANDFSNLNRVAICEVAWCLSNVVADVESLFDVLEKEILTKGKKYFRQKEISFIKYSFRKVGKGSGELFRL